LTILFHQPAIIVNPRSAAGRTARLWSQRESVLKRVFPEIRVEQTSCVGDAANLTRGLLTDGCDLIITVGGDGTLNEVANGFFSYGRNLFPDATLALLPSGTGSDYARSLGLPDDFEEAASAIQTRPIQLVDVGRLLMSEGEPSLAGDPFHGGTERYFLNEAGVGMSSKVVERTNRCNKIFGGKPTFLWQTLRTLMTWRNIPIQIKADEKATQEYRINSLFVANGKYSGGGMSLAPHASIQNGRLAITIFADLPRLEAVRRLGEAYQGCKIDHPEIHYTEVNHFEITTPGLTVETDGEIAGPTPARFEIIPASLRVAGVSF